MDGSLTKVPTLTINRHPILIDAETKVHLDLIPGESLHAFLHRHIETVEDQPMTVRIGGVEIPRTHWKRIKPKDGHNIEVRFGVGKTALFIVAMIALTIFTMGAAAAIAAGAAGAAAGTGVAAGFVAGMTAAGISAAAQMAIVSAIQVVGAMVINKVLGPKPPKPGSTDRDSVFNISGTRNQVRQYEPMGLLIGDGVKVAPDVISIPYSYYENNDQYMGMILSPGINVYDFGDLYIGDTLLSTYQDVQVWTAGFPGKPDQQIPLFTNVDQVAGGELEADFNVPGPWMVRTTSPNTITIQVDITYLLFDKTSKGKDKNNQETIQIEYRPVGAGDTGWINFQTVLLVSSKTTGQRRTYRKDVTEGQYEVRVRRLGRDTDGSGATANFQWATLTSIQADKATYAGIPRIAIKIKATGQLSGTPDQIKAAMRARPMPFWDGQQWTTATDRTNGLSNPGAFVLQYLRGFRDENGVLIAGMGLSDSMIDIESFKDFMTHCRVMNFTYNKWISDARSHDDIISEVMMAGMGRYTWAPGKLTALWVAQGQAAEGIVTMANIKKGEFQIDYSLMQSADGIEYTYLDRAAGWEMKTLRVPLPGVTVMENPARLTGEGIDNEAQAAIIARWHMGQNLYQFKDVVYGQDLEHLSYGQWSVVQLSHDLTQWGYSGRLISAVRNGGTVTLTLDTPVPGQFGTQTVPYIGLRIPGEGNYRVMKVKPFSGDTDTIVLDQIWPLDAAFPGDSDRNPVHDTIFLYDFKQTPGLRCRVVGISPADDLAGASVSVVPESDEFWHYVLTGEYIPPKNESLLRPQGQVRNLKVREERVIQGDTVFSNVNATWTVTGYCKYVVITAGFDGDPPEEKARTSSLSASWRVDGEGLYLVTARPYDDNDVPGEAQIVAYQLYGANQPPVNADQFFVEELKGGIRRYSWGWFADTIQSPDYTGVQIRYMPGFVSNPVWANMTPLGDQDGYHAVTFESTIPVAGEWTFALRAVNTGGLLSQEMVTVQKMLNFNLGEQMDEVTEGLQEAFNRIYNETQERVAAIGAVVDQVEANAAAADAKIVAETEARQNDVSRLETDIATNASSILNEKLEREAAITAEEQVRQSADESLAFQISQISAGNGQQFDSKKIWYFDDNAEGWNGTASGGFLNPGAAVATSPSGLAINSTSYRYVKMRVQRVGSPTWLGKIGWAMEDATTGSGTALQPSWDANGIGTVDLDNIPWDGGTLDSINVQLGVSVDSANYFLFDYIAVGRPTPGASVAMVQEETQARIAGDAAEAFQRNTLAVQMRGDYTGDDPASLQQGLVFNERNARIEGDEINATAIESLQVRADGIESAVTTETQARIDGDTALAEQITTLHSELDGKADASAVQQLTTRVEETEEGLVAVSQSVLKLDAQLSPKRAGDHDWRASDRNVYAGARTIYSVIAEGDRALATQMTVLQADYGDFKSGVTQQIEVISDEVSSNSQALTALTAQVAGKASAESVSLLTARVEVTETGLITLGQNIDQVNVVLAGKAESSAVAALQSQIQLVDDKVTVNSTAITNVNSRVDGKADASVVQQLSTDITTVNGRVTAINAQYFLAVEANGLIGGMKIGNNGSVVNFAIQADRFIISAPGGGQRTEYSNGNWRAYDANGTMRTRWGTW